MSDLNLEKLPGGFKGMSEDIGSDQTTFKGVNWGKAMMWIFLLSDTFVFSCFLIAYMKVRASVVEPWPYPSEVFARNDGSSSSTLINCNNDLCVDYKQRNYGTSS